MASAGIPSLLAQYSYIIAAVWVSVAIYVIGRTLFILFGRYVLKIKKGETTLQSRVISEIQKPFEVILLLLAIYYFQSALNLLPGLEIPLAGSLTLVMALLGVYIARKAIYSTIIWYSAKDKRRLNIEQTALMSLRTLISVFIYAVAAIIVLSQFGIEITPLLASLGIGGVAIALALQSTLSNYFAGVYLASDKTMRIGDFVELEGETSSGEKVQGFVEKMTWRSIWIRTFANNMIVVPNFKVSESIVLNYDQPKQPMTLRIAVGIAYSSDLQKVEDVTLRVAKKVAKETGATIEEEEPFIRFYEFGDSNINFKVFFKIKRWDFQFLLKHAFIKELMKEYNKEGIEISFPCSNVYMRTPLHLSKEDKQP